MQQVRLLFDNSPWLLLPCLVVGLLYAALLYVKSKGFKNNIWDKRASYALSLLRFVLVSLLCVLLVGPFIKQIMNTVEKPVVILGLDNSSSVASVEDSATIEQLKQTIAQIGKEVEDKGYLLEYRSFTDLESLDSLRFDYTSSDINGLLQSISADYEGRNLASVVLFSDGIYNQGISPTYHPHPFTINTVGLGDTVPKQDINVKTLYYNKIAYQGNKFPVVAEIANTGFAGETVEVTVSNRGKRVATKSLKFDENKGLSSLEFLMDANQEGIQHYIVEVKPKDTEFTAQNNTAHAYIEIIEGKEKILLMAQAPHPDIKAIKSAIENNKNYELQLAILSTDDNLNRKQLANEKYDLVIFHQLPGKGITSPIVNEYLEKASARWFIAGSQADLPGLSRASAMVDIASLNNDSDEVSAVYNAGFSGFQMSNENQSVLEKLPPLTVPFGRVELKNNANSLLFQKVGSVSTNKPMLVIGEQEGKKTAVMLAEGMWKWRLQEYAKYDHTTAFDALVTKLVQYLSAKEDKRRFKVYPIKNEFQDTEPVVFETEIYNTIYEQVYGHEVNLKVTSENGENKNFSYVTNESNTQYRISTLPEGIYQYQASVNFEGQTLTSAGEFTVRSLQVEALDLTANHEILKQLAEESGGAFFKQTNLNALAEKLSSQEAKGKIYTSEAYLPIINLKWLFFVLMLLATVEWGIRKYLGSY